MHPLRERELVLRGRQLVQMQYRRGLQTERWLFRGLSQPDPQRRASANGDGYADGDAEGRGSGGVPVDGDACECGSEWDDDGSAGVDRYGR